MGLLAVVEQEVRQPLKRKDTVLALASSVMHALAMCHDYLQ